MALIADYSLIPALPAPDGYPREARATAFAESPGDAGFAARRRRLLDHLAATPAPPFMKAPHHELARMAAGGTPHPGIWQAALDFIDARRDCADFVVHAVLRWLLQFPSHPDLLALESRAWRSVLGFKYWPDEPGSDSLCTWTENHQILYSAAAYVAGERRSDGIFTNSGVRGRELMARHRPRIDRWLDLRFRTGFSEWLSHVYYDEDVVALLTLADFAHDAELRCRAAMVLDLILLDIALNQFRGVFGSTHGRSYESAKKWAREECTSDLQWLTFGMGAIGNADSMSAIALALSTGYRVPEVIAEIARSRSTLRNRQRMGLRLADAERWGLGFDDFEDGMTWLSIEAYTHPRTIALVLRMFDEYRWWENSFFAPFAAKRSLLTMLGKWRLLPALASLCERDVTRNTREQVDIITYRTPDYMLSSAQDYRGSYGGDQQHIWQATLGPDAVCFTTHPARLPDDAPYATPGYWSGCGTLPRVAQIDNVALIVHEISTAPGLYLTNRLMFTHAWLPRDHFDEVIERAGWIFARRGDGYLALRSQHPYRWQTEHGENCGREVIVDGLRNIWICELGRRDDDGPFESFVSRIVAARIEWGLRAVRYASPSQGVLEWSATGPLRRNGAAVTIASDFRYDNPFVQAPFPSERVTVEANGLSLELVWTDGTRRVSP